MDNEVPGAVGTSASFALRLGQSIFSAASLLFMSLGVEFHNYTAFCIILGLIDVYSVLIRCPIRQPGILLFIVLGDWVLSFLTLAAASSIAGIVDVLHRISAGLALLSWFLSMVSSLSNLWLLPSLTR
ncbi:unnamed protein product [Withania somnifera]